MTIPDFQTIMLPLLKLAGDGENHHIHQATEELANQFNLTEEEKEELLRSGTQTVIYNRVGWARTYLKKSVLLESTARGYFRITERGKGVLEENPPRIDIEYLRRYPEFAEFRARNARETDEENQQTDTNEALTPQEALEKEYLKIRNDLGDELIGYVLESSPSFFEKLVVDLLVAMGYGGTHQDAARAVGRTGDEGIDGIIDEDRLGLDKIYIQAKRWQRDTTVGRPQIQNFVGALHGRVAKKGIFVTTAHFSNEARQYAEEIDLEIALIDGDKLADYMIDFGVGVTTRNTYEIKELDSDYFIQGAVG